MIKAGTLKRPLDVFDFLMHLAPFLLLPLNWCSWH
jgi:hypothetical protein